MKRLLSRHGPRFALGLTLSLGGVACGGGSGSAGGEGTGLTDKDAGLDAAKPRATDAGKKDASNATSGSDAGDAIGKSTGLGLPSDVCSVLQNNGCTTCHKTPTAGGAPMALTMRDDFAGNALDGTPLAQRVLERVSDTSNPMPPVSSGNPMLASDDVATLSNWVEDGIRGVSGGGACGASDAGVEAPVTWASNVFPDESECDYIMTLGAHGAAGTPFAMDPTPFPIPSDSTHYECFYEYVPWGDTPVQATAIRARVESPDDLELVHHFVVSSSAGLPSVAGQVPTSNGDHKPCENPSGSTVGIYAPGAFNPLAYPSDTGVIMPSGAGAYIEFQIHYNNPHNEVGKQSRAQYDICVSKTPRKNTAGVFWLGYENAFYDTLVSGKEQTNRLDNQNNGTAIGKCSAKEKTRILSIMPHMHQAGRHDKLEIMHKNGSVDTILDQAFDFQDQTSYLQQDLWVDQGDTVRTTCTWDQGPKYFGFGSEDEMCFFYVLAYPLTGLQAGPFEKGFVGGDLSCAGMAGP